MPKNKKRIHLYRHILSLWNRKAINYNKKLNKFWMQVRSIIHLIVFYKIAKYQCENHFKTALEAIIIHQNYFRVL